MSLRSIFLNFLTAFRFLTIIPVSWRAEDDHLRFKDSLGYFPVVGLVIGIFGFFLVQGLLVFLPVSVTTVLCIIYLAGISGCLHMDGLADSADGLLSSRLRDEMLRIMKDSRSGVMGVIAVVFCIMLKYSALSSALHDGNYHAVLLMPLMGRCAILFTMARLPYARKEGGLGLLFYASDTKKKAFVSIVIMVLLNLLLYPGQLLKIMLVVSLFALLFNRWCKNKLGGATGDTLGAVCEITETATVLAITVAVPL